MKISFVQVPYHLGREDVGVANGPLRMREAGIDAPLVAAGHDVEWQMVRRTSPFEDELTAVGEINALVKTRIEAAVAGDRFPILACGNCITAHGALAAMDVSRTGIIWCDAHGDFNTPDTSASGFLDGMARARWRGGRARRAHSHGRDP